MEDKTGSFGLSVRTVNELLNYFKKNPFVETVKIFGSRAKGCYRNGSDIDFAVWLKDGGKAYIIKSDLYVLPTPYKFDVADYNHIENESMKKSIDTDGILFYQRNAEQI